MLRGTLFSLRPPLSFVACTHTPPKAIARLAEAHGIAVLFGYPEVETSSPDGEKRFFNSAIFIDKHGNTLLNYRHTASPPAHGGYDLS